MWSKGCAIHHAHPFYEAENDWNHLTAKEKEKRARFQVSLVHVSYIDCDDGTRFSYFDTGKIIDGDVYDVAKSWL